MAFWCKHCGLGVYISVEVNAQLCVHALIYDIIVHMGYWMYHYKPVSVNEVRRDVIATNPF